jgi:DNA modification methylase
MVHMPDGKGILMESKVLHGDCMELVDSLDEKSVDIMVTSPPYWGQRSSSGMGTEEDPRKYLQFLASFFQKLKPKMKDKGILWINIGDSYNTPVNWGSDDWGHSTLGKDSTGFDKDNAAYTKPRHKRKAFIEKETSWLTYGNLLALPQRLIVNLSDLGFIFRGEVIWNKKNAMPEGRCRRPHRKHELILLFAVNENHQFRVKPPVPSVWTMSNEHPKQKIRHYSRFPIKLPLTCIEAYGKIGSDVLVLDPFSGSGTSGAAALQLGCSYIGFEIDEQHVISSKEWFDEIMS